MKKLTGQPEIRTVCDWCKGDGNCYSKCFLCKRDVCYPCQEKIGMTFKYSWPYANTLWICGECQKKNKDDYLVGMLYQLDLCFDSLSRYQERIEKMAKNLNKEIEKEMEKRGLK